MPSNEAGGPKPQEGKRRKIIIDTQPERSDSCITYALYAVSLVLILMYGAFVVDRENFKSVSKDYALLGHVHDAFLFIEEYSPFHQFLESDEEFLERVKATMNNVKKTPDGLRVFTKEELSKYDGSQGGGKNEPIYLAFLGEVYDVTKGAKYYGPGGGYAFFAAKDGSRAFVTGQFDDAGLVDDLAGLESSNYLGLKEWSQLYTKDYTKIGVLEGRYYDSEGEVTEEWKKLQGWIRAAEADAEKKDVEKQMFPPCNVEWSKEKGSRFWCTKRSGGVERSWEGVPRRLFYPGREERCACIRTSGPPSVDPSASSDNGDLDNPHLKLYPGCKPTSKECWKKE